MHASLTALLFILFRIQYSPRGVPLSTNYKHTPQVCSRSHPFDFGQIGRDFRFISLLYPVAAIMQKSSATAPRDGLERLLRDHHARVLAGTIDLSTVPNLAAGVFKYLQEEAQELASSPLTAPVAHAFVLKHSTLAEAISHALVGKIINGSTFAETTAEDLASLRTAYCSTMMSILEHDEIMSSIICDLAKAWIADPATQGLFQPCFFFKGFQALTTYRVAHHLWGEGGAAHIGAALLLQSRMAELFAVDIHPAAVIGAGIMLDHASGIVIGATTILGNDIYMLHSTTLGSTGKPMGDRRRHPKIGDSCVLGAGCTVLGDVTIGDKVTIGAAAVVTKDCPAGVSVIGVNNVIQRKPPPQRAGAAAELAAMRRGASSVREQFELRMEQQEATAAASQRADDAPASGRAAAPSAKAKDRVYLPLTTPTQSSTSAGDSLGAAAVDVDDGVYDFYGETGDSSWMYDRKAVEVIKGQDDDEGTYDMFF